MSAPPLPLPERLASRLRDLCAVPTDTARPDDLCAAADLLGTILHGMGMMMRRVDQAGIPLLIARRPGRSNRTLLLYHHYDTAPAGPWRAWSHDPFALAERDGALYARGVVDGKGPLAAHLQALETLIAAEGDLPCTVVLVAEGAAHQGSPHLAETLAAHADLLAADGVLGSIGERTDAGIPLCYSGSKGLLQVRLSARGAAHAITSGFAPTVRNPLWRLIWALSHMKGEDEDIRIAGFYDAVEGPTRQENAQLRRILFDEPARLAALGGSEFLFGMSGAALVRAETTLPTCNIGAIVCEPLLDHAQIPASASARIDFQLVPNQDPETILALLRAHLAENSFGDILVESLGGYPPLRTAPDDPFILAAGDVGRLVYGEPLPTVPAGSFVLPLHTLAAVGNAPAATIGLRRPTSNLLGPDEHAPLDDLLRHGELLSAFLRTWGQA